MLADTCDENTVAHDLLTRRPFIRFGCNQQFEHMIQVISKMAWYSLVGPFKNLFVKKVHICGLERYFTSDGFIQYTAKRPYVALGAVRFVFPHFRTGVERGTRLGVVHALSVTHFRYIHIANLDKTRSTEKNICGFQISVHDFQLVQSFEPKHTLHTNAPHFFLLYQDACLFCFLCSLVEITPINILHYDAKSIKKNCYHRLWLGSSMKASL